MKLTEELEQRIDQWVAEHSEDFLRDLGELVAFKSIASEELQGPEAPFGAECAAVLKRAAELAESYGFSAENRDNYCVVASVGEGEEKIGILGHLDVVPAGGEWNFPPFELTRRETDVIGRGVLDDKGPLWAGVYAARCLKELESLPERKIEIFMGSDEECGMHDIDHYRETSASLPVVSFTPDGNYPICHGEKGIMGFVLEKPVSDSNIVEFFGGTVSNVVADHAEIVFSGLDYDFVRIALSHEKAFQVERAGRNVRIIATGAAVHASLPEGGINAIGILAEASLRRGFARGGAVPALAFISEILSSYNGAPLDAAFEDEPSGKLTHVGGVLRFEDEILKLTIDIRYPVTVKGEDVISAASAAVARSQASLTNSRFSAPTYTPADSELISACTATVNRVLGKQWAPYTMGGGTYARHMPNAYAVGPEDPDWKSPFGPYRGSIHQPDESAPISLLLNTIRIYARLLAELDDIKVDG